MKSAFLPLAAAAMLAAYVSTPVQAEEVKAPDTAPAASPAAAPAPSNSPSPAQTSGAAPPSAGDGTLIGNPPEADMTPAEKAERDARKACKADICSAFRNKKAEGADVSCPIIKSWRKEALSKLVSKLKVSWPYGPVHCSTTVKLKRADLVKGMTDDKYETKLEKHAVACTVDLEKDAATEIKFDFSPTVTFEKGKATYAKINWGKIEAPALIKSALWTATAADNTVNILSSTLVDDINGFIDKQCDEIKSDWEGK